MTLNLEADDEYMAGNGMMDTLRTRVRQGAGVSVDCGTLRYEWVEGGSNGIQTFFMTAEELEAFSEKQMKKFGRINLKTMKTEKWVKDHWETDDDEFDMNRDMEDTSYDEESEQL